MFYFVRFSGEAQGIEESLCYETVEQIWNGKLSRVEIL